jgi:hypothetical protein
VCVDEEGFTDPNLFKVSTTNFKDTTEAIGMLSDAQIEQLAQGLSVKILSESDI